MGRPPSDLDDYLEWQQKLQSFEESGLSVDVFCLQEGVSRSTFYRWMSQLKEGIPESISAEAAEREQAESAEAVFMPITLKASPWKSSCPMGAWCGCPWESVKSCWWKSFEPWAPCGHGGLRRHDTIHRHPDLPLHDADEHELQF